MSLSFHDLELTKEGRVWDSNQEAEILEAVMQYSDLCVISHGWNNDRADAQQLYDAFFQSLREVLDTGLVPGLEGRPWGVVRVFWPSKRFADEDLIPGGGAASATRENDAALLHSLEQLKSNPERLGGQERDPLRENQLTRAQHLIPALETDPEARREFVSRLHTILDPNEAHTEDGSEEFFTRDAEELFRELEEPVAAPLAPGAGGATSVGDVGGAARLGDLLRGPRAAARRIANYTTYYEMKQRAGTVGRTGLAPLLRRCRDRRGDLRLHLIGHSFGGRLVTAAAHVLPANTPGVTLTLLQAAFSHNGFAERFDGRNDGFFRRLLSERRVSGPILITHTKNDRAVGTAYPLASRLARDRAAALGDQDDPYGGMGRNGAQHTPEVDHAEREMRSVGPSYRFTAGNVFNLQADRFISDHGAVTGHAVVYALLHAIKTIS